MWLSNVTIQVWPSGGALRRDRRTDRAGGAGLVVDHGRPAGVVAHLGGEDARHRIGRAAGREGHDDAQRAFGPVTRLGAGDGGEAKRAQQQCATIQPGHHPPCFSAADRATAARHYP
jgi:hypothetical protein